MKTLMLLTALLTRVCYSMVTLRFTQLINRPQSWYNAHQYTHTHISLYCSHDNVSIRQLRQVSALTGPSADSAPQC